ncbi:hypothetical protein H310_06113 [Aphanomyces invadans]|uniref:GST N-terminal domain-containing protein n=1 Tax=Aphanomyces invadans TaxID=157072 RepID=A0A024UAJ0_9STRA|nr:hypothetical protein H310_06113 [Aphanomyces invadans]ETW02653.1 hypothetical protein H310_06113 [Aphanomyces invadans]|eukprot:XP_008869258.1 hypothetical protein H310_06113 [Aphanomyces invadans]
MGPRHVLVTIPASNYCEKARWGLRVAKIDFVEEMHAPLFHYMSTKPKGGKSVPLLVTSPSTCLKDSDAILTLCGTALPSLYPHPGVKEKELWFDNQFGPAARRFGYGLVFSLPPSVAKGIIIDPIQGTIESYAASAAFPLLKSALTKALNITEQGVERSWTKIQSTFNAVNDILGDKPLGAQFVAGTSFTAADISFCSHASLILAPPQNPFLAQYINMSEAPRQYQDRHKELVESKAGQFVLWCYENYYLRAPVHHTAKL